MEIKKYTLNGYTPNPEKPVTKAHVDVLNPAKVQAVTTTALAFTVALAPPIPAAAVAVGDGAAVMAERAVQALWSQARQAAAS